MNLTEVLNSALPEIPVRTRKERYPRIHPNLIAREHRENGESIVNAVISGKCWIYRLTPLQWRMAQLFDGMRSYEEIIALFYQQTGVAATVEELREFVDGLESEGFWYKTSLEESIAFKQKLAEDRQKHAKKRDISYLAVSGWDPDIYLDKVYPYLKILFTPWFTVSSLALFGFQLYIFATHWHEYFNDTIQFFDFTEKSLWDIVGFYLLGCVVLFVHEAGHALACKHYGGRVHDMGFLLIYFTPAFYVDSTEVWVYGNRTQRLLTVVWGAWAEMLIGIFATPIWWGTPRGSLVNEIAYKLILITGLSVIFFNWNPLIKLDGYYLFTELVGIADIKEKSTAYVTGWLKKNIFRLPIQLEHVPRKHRRIFVAYALLSGAYCYFLLYVFAHWIGNICRSYSPQWGFLGGLLLGYLLFRSRIKALGRFMKSVYLDKRERVRAWFTPARGFAVAATALAVMFAPVWRESIEGRFVLEPYSRAVVRNQVAGVVSEVLAAEGQHASSGALVARLRDLQLETDAAQAQVDFRTAAARAASAQWRYTNYGPAELERQRLAEKARLLSDKVSHLQLFAPISGTVVTPRLHDRLGSYLQEGTEIAEIADLSSLRARVFLPEFEMRKARINALARLVCDSSTRHIEGVVAAVAPVSSEVAPGLMQLAPYKGLTPPAFYVLDVVVSNSDGRLLVGSSGTARIYTARRSLAGLVWQPIWDFLARKIW